MGKETLEGLGKILDGEIAQGHSRMFISDVNDWLERMKKDLRERIVEFNRRRKISKRKSDFYFEEKIVNEILG